MDKVKIIILLMVVLILFSFKIYCQDTTANHIEFNIRYSFNYNYKIAHHSPAVSLEYANHNFYIGPEYSLIIKPLGDPEDVYEKKSIGLNFGYRYFFFNQSKLKLFGQLNYSLYHYKYKEYQLGLPFATEQKKLTIENTGTLGIDYGLNKNIHLFTGIGIGSTHGFFLILDSLFACSYIGLDFKF